MSQSHRLMLGALSLLSLVAGSLHAWAQGFSREEPAADPEAEAQRQDALAPPEEPRPRAARPPRGPARPDRMRDAVAERRPPEAVAADRAVSRAIRRVIMIDKDLSESARGARVSTREGKVTLRGTVESQDESAAVAAKAAAIVGFENVENRLNVRSPEPQREEEETETP